MSEEFEIESFEDLIDVFENTGDFGKYYLGNYSNIQIANYLRNLQQENKQLKENYQFELEENSKLSELWCKNNKILTELEEWLKEQGNNGIDEWGNHYTICLYKLNELKEKYK